MKKITLFLVMLGFFLTANAQYVFNPIAGPTNVAQGTPVTINLNDIANTEGVTASSTGSYDSFSITVDWTAGSGGPWSSEADLTVTTTAGSVTIDPPTTGGANSGAAATLTFEGELNGFYDPTTDGFIDLVLNQSFGGSDADWSNIVVTLFETPTCPEPLGMNSSVVTATTANLDWVAGNTENSWNIEYNSGADFTPGNGEEEGSTAASGSPSTNLTGLSPASEYYVYYQADCGPGDFSLWVGPFIFNTECVTFTAPYTEDFENSGSIPLCWSMAGGEDWNFDLAADVGGEHVGDDGVITGSTASNNYFAWADASGNDGPITLTSPLIDVSSLTDPALSFYLISDNEGNANCNLDVEVWDGAAWNNLGTFNSNTSGWEQQILGLAGLTITGDIQIRFTFSETVTGDFYDDIAIDDVTVDEAPDCIAPSGITASNITGDSADISWNANNAETSWEYVVVPAGTGEPSGPGTTITTTSVALSALDFSTSYEIWVRADCGANGMSNWSGPVVFDTPIQTNFTLDCTNGGPLNIDYCYDNGGANNPLIFTFTSNDGTPLNLVFNSGNVENNWDELVVFDSDGNPFPGFAAADDNYGNAGDIGGISFQSTGDTISWYVNSDTSVSCGSGSAALVDGINYTVSCATCVNPQATYTVIDDCANGDQFLIDVDITDLGDATSLTISNNIDANTTAVTTPGVYQIGPFPFLQDVIVTVNNDQDSNCVINSQAIQLLACPPDNDNCDGAITAAVNETDLCNVVTPGTILAATPSGVANTCAGNPDDDVWFEFTALSEAQFISLINIQGGTTNLDHALYEGTCDGLTELYCSAATSSIANVTIGNTYYIRVFSGGDDAETSTFDLCIREAPTNTICEGAENFCAVGDALVGSNIIGLPDPTQVACLGTVPNPSWNIIQIGESGLIEIEIIQWEDDNANGIQDAGENGLDVDFAIWGPFTSVEQACMDIELVDCPSCPFSNNPDTGFYPFGNIIDCSYSGAAIENLTIDNAQEGEIYMLLVTNFNGGAGVISIEQTNVGDMNDGVITADIEAEIISTDAILLDTGDDVTIGPETYDIFETSLCGFNSITIEAESAFADEYVWYKDGFEIPGETSSTLTVTESDNYWVKAIDEQCGSEAFSQFVIVNLYQDPGTVATQNITLCDGPEADGTEIFDLNQLTTDIGLGADFAVRYYTNIADAQAAMNEVTGPYTSSGETLIIRIEDVDKVANNDTSGNCVEITEVNLVVLATPSIGMPMNLETCSALSSAEFTLTDNDTAVLNGLNAADYTVTYHSSETDAENGASPLASPHNGTDGEIIHVRLEEIATGCYNIASFSLEISAPTQTATSQNIEECDDNDGLLDDMADFDLAAHTTIVLDGQDPSSYNVTYHTSQADADNNTGALPTVYSTASTVIYVRVEDAILANCYVTTTFNLVVLDEATATIETNVFYYDEVTSEFLLCPETETGANLTIVPNNFTTSEVSVQWLVDDVEIAGATELTYEAVSQGDYSAVITLNATGCSFTISDITVNELENCVIPQGISPGVSAGLNDTFDLRYYDVTRLEIFNRNGTLVYSKDNYTNEWVGQTDDGEELPVGTYFYTMVYEGGTKTRSAWVYINR